MSDEWSTLPEDPIRKAQQAFVEQFLPPGVMSAHGLLYDFDGTSDFAPSEAELRACIEAYTRLVDVVTAQHALGAIFVIDASELLLAYLTRSDGLEGRPAGEPGRRLHRIIADAIQDIENFADGKFARSDAFKRLVAIRDSLDERSDA